MDKNNDKKVSVDELKAFLDSAKCTLDKKKIQTFINANDTDGDGMLNLEELITILSS